jgi:hypothetical protein
MNPAGADAHAFLLLLKLFPKACMEFLRVDECREKQD